MVVKRSSEIGFPFFQSSRSLTSSKIIEPNLNSYVARIFIRYIKFELNMCNGCSDTDRKVNDDGLTGGRNNGTISFHGGSMTIYISVFSNTNRSDYI